LKLVQIFVLLRRIYSAIDYTEEAST